MTVKKQKPFQKILLMIALIGGLVLMIAGVINGNQTMIKPDLSKSERIVKNEKLNPEQLTAWQQETKKRARLIIFDSYEDCGQQMARQKASQCYAVSELKDLKWIRTNFRKITWPMVVYSNDAVDRLKAASTLHYYGYNVRMLELPEKESNFFQNVDRGELGLIAQLKVSKVNVAMVQPTVAVQTTNTDTSGVSDIQQSVLTPAVPSSSATEEEEEEEEGC